jgi:hypothetical protein
MVGVCDHPITGPGSGERTMLRRQEFWTLFCLTLLFTVLRPPTGATAADKDTDKQGGKVAGILIDKRDNTLIVKADGEDEPVKYVVGTEDKKLAEYVNKTIFNACRVELTYKMVGDTRQVVRIKRQILQSSGTTTGVVVKVYNDFWIEVKPKNGPSDAFAPSGANYNKKDFMEKLKSLQPGDSVTIKFTTDFERHRIESLRKN